MKSLDCRPFAGQTSSRGLQARGYGRRASVAKKIETPPPIEVPAPFSSRVAKVRPSVPNTLTVGRTAYETLAESSFRSRSDRGTSGMSLVRHARLTPTLAPTFGVTVKPAATPLNHNPGEK